MRDFAIGFALGAVALGLVFVIYDQNKKNEVEEILTLSEPQFLASEQKLKDLGGVNSKALLALLSCVQLRKEKAAEFETTRITLDKCQSELGIAKAEIETLKVAQTQPNQGSAQEAQEPQYLGPFNPANEPTPQMKQAFEQRMSEAPPQNAGKQEEESVQPRQEDERKTEDETKEQPSQQEPQTGSSQFLEFDYLPRQASVLCENNLSTWFVAGEGVDDYRLQVRHDKENTIASIQSLPEKPTRELQINRCGNLNSYRGKRVLFKASVRLTDVNGDANLHIFARDKSGKIIQEKRRRLKGTFRWITYRIRMTVPKNTENLVFGFLMESQGRIQIRKVTFGESGY